MRSEVLFLFDLFGAFFIERTSRFVALCSFAPKELPKAWIWPATMAFIQTPSPRSMNPDQLLIRKASHLGRFRWDHWAFSVGPVGEGPGSKASSVGTSDLQRRP